MVTVIPLETVILLSPRGTMRFRNDLYKAFKTSGIRVCDKCNNLVNCVCQVLQQHNPGCRFRVAAGLSFELACEHGFQACPICDPCTCGIAVEGIR